MNMMEEYCQTNFVDKGMIADYCIHDKQDGNPHCHILLTMRPLTEKGEFGAKCKQEYVVDDTGERIKLPSGNWKSFKVDTTDWNSPDNAEKWREGWANTCNRFLSETAISERIDHRSYERQGIDQIPTIHMGVSACQMERKGIATNRGNTNRKIVEDNKTLRATRARITRLMKWQREEKAKPLDLTQTSEKISVTAMLSVFKDGTASSQYQKVKRLKDNVGLWNFMREHNIENVEDFYQKIVDMNTGFYALQDEVKKTSKTIADLGRKISLWEDYEKATPVMEKYNALSDVKKKATYEKNKSKIDRALEVKKTWQNFKGNGGSITPKQWANERTKLQGDIVLYTSER